MLHPSDQLICKLTIPPSEIAKQLVSSRPPRLTHELERLDGTKVPIEIGQQPYSYTMPNKPLWTWNFQSYSPDLPSQKQHRAVFQEAFRSIEKIIPQKISYEKTNKKTDFTIHFSDDISVFNNKKSTLAQAYLFYPNSDFNGVIEFNDSPEAKYYFTPLGWPVPAYLVDPINFKKGDKNPNGTPIMRASQPLLQIAMHEIRHATGERHDIIDPKSIMAPYTKKGWINNNVIPESFQWTNKDISLLEEDFGRRNLLIRHLYRWRSRKINRSLYERYLS